MKEKEKIIKKSVVFLIVLLSFLVGNGFVLGADLDLRTNETIIQSYYNVKEETLDLADKGMPVIRILNLVNEGEILLNSKDFSSLKEKVKEINRINSRVKRIKENIDKTKIKIRELKKNEFEFENEEEKLQSAIESLEMEDYGGAASSLSQISSELDKIIIETSKDLDVNLEELDTLQNHSDIGTTLFLSINEKVDKARRDNDYAYIISLFNKIGKLNNTIIKIAQHNERIFFMDKSGRKTTRIKDLRSEAINALDNEDYDRVDLINDEMQYLFEIILDSEDLISKTKEKIKQLNYLEEISEINQTLQQAIENLNNENYEDAQELIHESYDLLNKIEAQSLLFGAVSAEKITFNIKKTIKEYPWIIPALIMFLLLFIIIYIKISRLVLTKWYTRRSISLEKERKVINSLIKKNQRDYYEKQEIDKDTYKSTLRKYQEILIKINEKLPVIKSKIKKLNKN